MNDCAVIEFDVIVSADALAFNYVFASSEYAAYTCSNYNDAFGLFVSGPGISGPYENDAINIALQNNYSLKQEAYVLEESKLKLDSSYSGYKPKIDLGYTYFNKNKLQISYQSRVFGRLF